MATATTTPKTTRVSKTAAIKKVQEEAATPAPVVTTPTPAAASAKDVTPGAKKTAPAPKTISGAITKANSEVKVIEVGPDEEPCALTEDEANELEKYEAQIKAGLQAGQKAKQQIALAIYYINTKRLYKREGSLRNYAKNVIGIDLKVMENMFRFGGQIAATIEYKQLTGKEIPHAENEAHARILNPLPTAEARAEVLTAIKDAGITKPTSDQIKEVVRQVKEGAAPEVAARAVATTPKTPRSEAQAQETPAAPAASAPVQTVPQAIEDTDWYTFMKANKYGHEFLIEQVGGIASNIFKAYVDGAPVPDMPAKGYDGLTDADARIQNIAAGFAAGAADPFTYTPDGNYVSHEYDNEGHQVGDPDAQESEDESIAYGTDVGEYIADDDHYPINPGEADDIEDPYAE